MTMSPETAQALGWLVGAARAARIPLGQDIATEREHLKKAKRANPQYADSLADNDKEIKDMRAFYKAIEDLERKIDLELTEEGFF